MLQLVTVIATTRDFKFFRRRKRAPCDYLFIAITETAHEKEEVRNKDIYSDIKKLQNIITRIDKNIENKKLPIEVQDLISSQTGDDVSNFDRISVKGSI